MSKHLWYYYKEGMFSGEEQIGPLSEADFKQALVSGSVGKNTKVMSPTRTKSTWTYAKGIPGLVKLIDQAAKSRREEKLEEAQRATPVEAAVVETEDDEQVSESRKSSKLRKAVSDYLMKGEHIETLVVQAKPIALKADGVVFTNKRLIIAKPKLLGRFEFHDVLWRDLGDAHVKENVIGATFEIIDKAKGQRIWLDMLPKKAAKDLYRIAQEREEEAFQTRRQMKMEEASAGAAKVSVATSAIPPDPTPSDDLSARLQKLKSMLDAGLIEQEDFDKQKSRILDTI